jgi:hypothetical protein
MAAPTETAAPRLIQGPNQLAMGTADEQWLILLIIIIKLGNPAYSNL